MFVQHKTRNTLQKGPVSKTPSSFSQNASTRPGSLPINGNSIDTSVCNLSTTGNMRPRYQSGTNMFGNSFGSSINGSSWYIQILLQFADDVLPYVFGIDFFSKKKKPQKESDIFNNWTLIQKCGTSMPFPWWSLCMSLYTVYSLSREEDTALPAAKKTENQILRKQLLPPSFSWVSRSPVRTFTLTTAADSKNWSKNHSHPTPIYPQNKRSIISSEAIPLPFFHSIPPGLPLWHPDSWSDRWWHRNGLGCHFSIVPTGLWHINMICWSNWSTADKASKHALFKDAHLSKHLWNIEVKHLLQLEESSSAVLCSLRFWTFPHTIMAMETTRVEHQGDENSCEILPIIILMFACFLCVLLPTCFTVPLCFILSPGLFFIVFAVFLILAFPVPLVLLCLLFFVFFHPPIPLPLVFFVPTFVHFWTWFLYGVFCFSLWQLPQSSKSNLLQTGNLPNYPAVLTSEIPFLETPSQKVRVGMGYDQMTGFSRCKEKLTVCS